MHAAEIEPPATESKIYGGIGRLSFAIVLLGVSLLVFFSASKLESSDFSVGFPLRMWIFLGILLVVGALPRTRNIGMHPAKSLLIFVPIANLILLIRCLAYQEGYEDTRRLDRAGKVIGAPIAVLSIVGYGLILYHDF